MLAVQFQVKCIIGLAMRLDKYKAVEILLVCLVITCKRQETPGFDVLTAISSSIGGKWCFIII